MTGPILVWPTAECATFLAMPIVPWSTGTVMPSPVWLPRDQVEDDPAWQQPIPYVVVRRDGQAWCYRRRRGEARLAGQRSCGVGGHLERCDARSTWLETARSGAVREVAEELGVTVDPHDLIPHAWIHEAETAVGRVHLGLVFALPWVRAQDPVPAEADRLIADGFQPLTNLVQDSSCERWSRLAARVVLGPSPS
jgi:predicted NUDIX family phosphoesterase